MNIKTFLGIIQSFRNWHLFLLDYFGLIRNQTILYTLRGRIKLYARAGTMDKNIITEIWVKQVYNPVGFEIAGSDLIIDIGAQNGYFSVFASKQLTSGKVIAYEPFPLNYQLLQKNLDLNQCPNVTINQLAVSDTSGKADFYIDTNNTGGHSLIHTDNNPYQEKVTIKTISLDQVVRDNELGVIDLLKLDCEGAEYKIFFNSSQDTLKKIRKISMEVHNIDDRYNINTLADFLIKNDFNVTVDLKHFILHAKKS